MLFYSVGLICCLYKLQNHIYLVSVNFTLIYAFLIPGTGTQACDVVISYGTIAPITLTNRYTYSEAKTPTVTSVTPKVGVTSGGDSLTITGTDFG